MHNRLCNFGVGVAAVFSELPKVQSTYTNSLQLGNRRGALPLHTIGEYNRETERQRTESEPTANRYSWNVNLPTELMQDRLGKRPEIVDVK